jgi:hypothetical protein
MIHDWNSVFKTANLLSSTDAPSLLLNHNEKLKHKLMALHWIAEGGETCFFFWCGKRKKLSRVMTVWLEKGSPLNYVCVLFYIECLQ